MASSASTASKPSPTATTKANRLPAPTLFVGPPSRNASQLSIARPPTQDTNSKPSTTRLRSNLAGSSSPPQARNDHRTTDAAAAAAAAPPLRKASTKNLESRWKDMRATLNEVEITAQSSTHVFGEAHAAALDTLRQAQVELARAWGRGSESRPSSSSTAHSPSNSAGGGVDIHRFKGADDLAFDRANRVRKRGDTNTSASTALSDESGLSEERAKSGETRLEDETAQDVKLASERRAANEAYFKKVDSGVKDVVAKLEKVAEAMRGVESEGRSLWSESGRSSTSGEEGREGVK
ncbi:unnamed protein product [Zymoseptoria tritici ST99CH_3D1]|uniref:Uncharacterized protein n=2 Tax=Zymoseptoria tritici TaxID=1047171 RepID=A0A1X7RTC4_ZYMT9|nr:unnamed protein product [Zymoseptoria tritici ST99CH_3D7]SMR52495.1 unnamed protein product [Zymoseptoria tritici ST99CH_1E4]SMR53695.1 unnamed protein product [Zymoseptoria tritici ST99CH_3D1]